MQRCSYHCTLCHSLFAVPTSYFPRFGFCLPAKIFKAVDFPIPLVPTNPRTSPGRGIGNLNATENRHRAKSKTWYIHSYKFSSFKTTYLPMKLERKATISASLCHIPSGTWMDTLHSRYGFYFAEANPTEHFIVISTGVLKTPFKMQQQSNFDYTYWVMGAFMPVQSTILSFSWTVKGKQLPCLPKKKVIQLPCSGQAESFLWTNTILLTNHLKINSLIELLLGYQL